nr:PREDICTED: transcription elongation factor B polypeptide 3-like isoform X6 [Latimeria chalumnae]|eukprot:XP_014354141.1 PREDICTED: transcription elongation factor B polypeptide 3-like isoform X6 [Latimeria chalumnae]
MDEIEEPVLQRILQLKECLSEKNQTKKILKALKQLQDLNITLDILVETGIGKTVNGFRKHEAAGDMAKSLVAKWKKLVPQENASDQKDKGKQGKDPVPEDHKKMKKLASSGENKSSNKQEKEKSSVDLQSLELKREPHKDHTEKSNNKQCESFQDGKCKAECHKIALDCSADRSSHHGNTKTHKLSGEKGKEKSKPYKDHYSSESKGFLSFNSHVALELEEKTSIGKNERKPNAEGLKEGMLDMTQMHSKDRKHPLDKTANGDNVSDKQLKKEILKPSLSEQEGKKTGSGDEVDVPIMSFEECLNYDQANTCKKKSRKEGKNSNDKPGLKSKVTKSDPRNPVSESGILPEGTAEKRKKDNQPGAFPKKKVKVEAITDLLKVPLPEFLPEESLLLSPPSYSREKSPTSAPNVCEETCGFTGRRLNSKMQVFSGSKSAYLPKMLTLYEQCIRSLQNNLDLLHEVGGVPFEILEPVLERCTPEQLYKIEQYNPMFVGETDHFWMKHCQRDFRNEQVQEYESWRELYLRLFDEREQKLKMVTKSIRYAHSGKPKAKPPRDVRRQQEIHGTAGPSGEHHPLDKHKLSVSESRDRNSLQTSRGQANTCLGTPISSGGINSDAKKPTKSKSCTNDGKIIKNFQEQTRTTLNGQNFIYTEW